MKRNRLTSFTVNLFPFLCLLFLPALAAAQETRRMYLSGQGNDDAVEWEFFCTEGRKAGVWTSIPVPSNWELHGFGTYNYGHDKDSVRGKEKGLYRYRFEVPRDWADKKIHIVFEGSMTDTGVRLNGKPAGPLHQGAFYRFSYDVTGLIETGAQNLLEVTVAKHSSNESVNRAERFADYWIFGGIFRPVYLEAFPEEHIRRTAINATADGRLVAEVFLENIRSAAQIKAQVYTLQGEVTGEAIDVQVTKGESPVLLQAGIPTPDLWSPEFPNLYSISVSLTRDGEVLHTVSERFGFRTVELRGRDGIYLNGTKIRFRGVCRHSFWPASGRTLNKALSIRDVNLMKDMNMNAVRCSHYPPDEHFLDACDSLGLMVLDELAGWHDAYDTKAGSVLAEEMLMRDMNHPCVVMWVNGNEGGHNHELLPLYDRLDIQGRPVIHAWETFRGMDTQHYINYDYGNGTHFHGHNVVFPTEFLHGLYDGGLGAGLEDYWELMWHTPLSAGGFLWDFSDEGVVRTDKGGLIDTDGDHAPDGILGPYREKEGSFFAIKEIWAPVYFGHREITPSFDGTFRVENRFFFTNLDQCAFSWKLARVPGPGGSVAPDDGTAPDGGTATQLVTGVITSPDVGPGEQGTLAVPLPSDWREYDVLYITALDPANRELFTWSWPVSLPERIAGRIVSTEGENAVEVEQDGSLLTLSSGDVRISLNTATGLLERVENRQGVIPFSGGPALCEGEADFRSLSWDRDGDNVVIRYAFGEESSFNRVQWTMYPSGWVGLEVEYCPVQYESEFIGVNFSYPEENIRAVRWLGDGPYRVWKNRMKGTALDVWEKEYNNTITGQGELVYPEFKGYHSRFYWAKFLAGGQDFCVVTGSEDVFLRLFTPDSPVNPYNTAPPFPGGDISFMHGIPPIGTKSQEPENTGPMGRKNMLYTYGNTRCKTLDLWFDFR